MSACLADLPGRSFVTRSTPADLPSTNDSKPALRSPHFLKLHVKKKPRTTPVEYFAATGVNLSY